MKHRSFSKGAVLPTVLLVLSLFSMLGLFIAYLTAGSIDDAKIDKNEFLRRIELRQALEAYEMTALADAELIGHENTCLAKYFNLTGIRKLMDGYSSKSFMLAPRCQSMYDQRRFIQEWVTSGGLSYKRDRYYIKEESRKNCIAAGWCFKEVKENRYNNPIRIVDDQHSRERLLFIDYEKMPTHEDEKSDIVKVKRWKRDAIVILDSRGRVWILQGEIDSLSYNLMGEIASYQKKKLIDYKHYSYLKGAFWHHYWINTSGALEIIYLKMNLNERRFYAINNGVHASMSRWNSNVDAIQLQIPAEQWYHKARSFNYVESGKSRDYLYIKARRRGKDWVWLLGTDGKGFVERTHFAFSSADESLIELVICSKTLIPIFLKDRWQIGCRLDHYSGYRFID